MNVASVAEVKAKFSAYLKASENEPVVVTRKGKPVAVLVAVADDEDLERLAMAHSPQLRSILEAARRRIKKGQGIPHRQFWQEINANKGDRRPS